MRPQPTSEQTTTTTKWQPDHRENQYSLQTEARVATLFSKPDRRSVEYGKFCDSVSGPLIDGRRPTFIVAPHLGWWAVPQG